MIDKCKQGKRNRRNGAIWERKVRDDLEKEGWFVSKFENNVDLDKDKMVPAKSSRFRLQSTGFPDFICWRHDRFIIELKEENIGGLDKKTLDRMRLQIENANKLRKDMIIPPAINVVPDNEIIGIECKVGKYISKEEKEKCRWLLKNRIFSRILIAYKTKEKNRVKINYLDFEEYDKR